MNNHLELTIAAGFMLILLALIGFDAMDTYENHKHQARCIELHGEWTNNTCRGIPR